MSRVSKNRAPMTIEKPEKGRRRTFAIHFAVKSRRTVLCAVFTLQRVGGPPPGELK